MGFSKKSPNVSVQNKFVSLFSEPYCWNSAQRPVINNPLNMDDYPTIRKVMGAINEQHGAKLNSCLVSYYKNGHVRARLHCDDEAELDHTQPIAVVSLGAVRNVEFVDNKQESFRTTARTLKPSNGSLYLMRAGCQQAFRHRVRMNKRVKDFRISISFRSFIPPGSVADLVQGPAPISPLCSDASFATCGSQASSLHTPTSPISPVVVKPVRVLLSAAASQAANARNKFSLRLSVPTPAENVADSRTVNEVSHPVSKPTALPSASLLPDVEGYSPFPQTPYTTSSAKPAVLDRSSERVCVIFGTSITEHVDGGLMSRGDRTVVNVSSSGADIDDIRQMAEDFHHENLSSIHKIDKIIVSVGTNDVKFYNSRVRNMSKDLGPKLISLVKLLKQLFPSAQVHFQTMLPIKIPDNEGPNSLSVSFQNVQGLIPFSQLGKSQPKLDQTKIFELNAYLNTKKPDILVLNETWLNKSVKDGEVIGNHEYDVYRNDRSEVTHPADPSNPKKFRKFGGGVLIAVRSSIDASLKRLCMRRGAEILAVELTVGINKYVFCTVYRVGNLGETNHQSIVDSIKS
ncbi:hypothetical protein ACHWQZ_G006737, partial [Mnemiopsis leidyi]